MENCRYCGTDSCVKAGLQKNLKQRYKCKKCNRFQQKVYTYKSYAVTSLQIVAYAKEGIGIRSMGRLLDIDKNTVINRIRHIADNIFPPIIYKPNRIYEMDEMHTFIQKKGKECWIMYAIDRITKQVIDFRLGSRAKSKLKPVIESMMLRAPKRIYTDRREC